MGGARNSGRDALGEMDAGAGRCRLLQRFDQLCQYRQGNRRLIAAEKFYLFDVGVTNYLARQQPRLGSPAFGTAFEQFVLMELKAFQAYRCPDLPIAFWRTSTGREADFILGERDLAIEVKASSKIHEADAAALKCLMEEKQARRLSREIEVIPWREFIERLWSDEFSL